VGLFDRMRGIADPVDGTFQLVACSVNSGGAVYENCTMDGVVSGPGVTPTSVHYTTLTAPTAKWPQPGQTLPVTFDRTRPDRLKIRWDEIPTTTSTAQAYAQQLAAEQAAAAAGSGPTPPAPTVPMPNGRPAPGQPGGGLTPQETAAALGGNAAAMGLVATTATVLASHEVDATVGPGGTWDLTLDIAPVAGSAGYTAVLRISFSTPAKRADIARTGRALPVLADPQRQDRIAIDTTRL
jgi:hypothetical protein